MSLVDDLAKRLESRTGATVLLIAATHEDASGFKAAWSDKGMIRKGPFSRTPTGALQGALNAS